jgi:hypothetical protein
MWDPGQARGPGLISFWAWVRLPGCGGGRRAVIIRGGASRPLDQGGRGRQRDG